MFRVKTIFAGWVNVCEVALPLEEILFYLRVMCSNIFGIAVFALFMPIIVHMVLRLMF